jgi:branched-chain amino acid transport system permease protein
VDFQRIAIVGFAAVLIFGLWIFTHHTSVGLAFRGIAQDERTALTFGIDSNWIATLSIAMGAGLAALAAVFIIPLGRPNGISCYSTGQAQWNFLLFHTPYLPIFFFKL